MADQRDRPPDSIALALTRVGGRETDGVEFAGAFPALDEAQLTGLRRFGPKLRWRVVMCCFEKVIGTLTASWF